MVALYKSVPRGFVGILAGVEYSNSAMCRECLQGGWARVWVDPVSKSRQAGQQHWRGAVELEAFQEGWVIASLKNLSEVP